MKRFARLTSLLLASGALAMLALGGCVENPGGVDEEVWKDAGSFAWPTELGTTMRYKVDSRTFIDDTTDVVVRAGKYTHDGKAMYRLSTSSRTNPEGSAANQLHFLPERDTLFTMNGLLYENGLKADYALVTPIEPGHTWIAAYADGTDSATVRGTIVERYSLWKLEGRTYENVVAVKYEWVRPQQRTEWIRFYAKDVGVILTVRKDYPISDYPTQAPPEENDRSTLVATTAAQ